MKATTFERLLERWQSDDSLKAGEEIYEAIAGDRRPDWAATILLWCLERSGLRFASVERVWQAALDPRSWHEAHRLFEDVRRDTLDHQDKPSDLVLLHIAETTAKVVYNASNYPAPFDLHAGWQMGPRLKAFVHVHASADVMDAWSLLIRPLATKSAE